MIWINWCNKTAQFDSPLTKFVFWILLSKSWIWKYPRHPSWTPSDICGHSSVDAPPSNWPSKRACEAILSIVLLMTAKENTTNGKRTADCKLERIEQKYEIVYIWCDWMYQICRENVHSSDGTNDDGAGTRASGEAATILQLRPCARHGDVASSLATNFHIRCGFKFQNNL